MDSRRILLFYANKEQRPWPIMPIGLSYVAKALSDAGHVVRVVDLMFSKDWPHTVVSAVAEAKPDFIGIGIRNADNCNWSDFVSYREIIKKEVVRPIREISPDTCIVIGGAAVNVYPAEYLNYLDADCAVVGDGERIILALAQSIAPAGNRTERQPIEGVLWNPERYPSSKAAAHQAVEVYRADDVNFVKNPEIHRFIDLRPYLWCGTPYPIQTKRGCQFNCSFCVYKTIEGNVYRLRDPRVVADEIESVYRETKVWNFEFTDSVFNHPLMHAKEVCSNIVQRRLPISLNSTGVNPQFFDSELLQLMEKAGFSEYSFAPDSASSQVLKFLGKGYTDPQILIRAAEIARTSPVSVMWWFSLGLPHESEETVRETLDFIIRHVRPTDLAFCSVGLRIQPDSPLERVARAEGKIPDNFSLFDKIFYEPENISLLRIMELLNEAKKQIPNLLTASDLPKFTTLTRVGGATKSLLKFHRPLWTVVPKINRVWNTIRKMSRAA